MALPKYYIPRDLERAIENESAASVGSAQIVNKFSLVLNELKNIDCLEIAEWHYLQFLKLGLYLEEYQQRKDMSKFEIHNHKIEKIEDSKKRFKIYIKDLDEDNPVLNVSDSLKVYNKSNPDTKYYLRVSQVCTGHVVVTANNKFCENHSDLGDYNIVLIFNSYTFQCCHYALTAVTSSTISKYFFPKKIAVNLQILDSIEKWFNSGVLNNPEQKQAVLNIVNKSAFPAPYILYGPPGTGKTSTLVEAVCQIWKRQPRDYILICAPSNAACDVVTKRLLEYIPCDNLYRIYSQSQEYFLIDKDIKNCCNYKSDGTIDDIEKVINLSSKNIVTTKNIIITTLCTSLRLEKLELNFSHVFIDEASQATLADAFLPACAVNSTLSVQLVISGDHQQLGPGIRSKFAEPLLGQSILEKLMKHDPYKKDPLAGYNPRYITKLIRNFRSSKAIIDVPNELFYDNELIACSNSTLSTFPVSFYAVEGREQKVPNSKSSYNEDEINEVLIRVKNFVRKRVGQKTIKQEDIGIVTPFSLQAKQMRKKLKRNRFRNVDVDTVEKYQGQEKEVIIITTVRSKTFVHEGIEHIGFLSNPRRFNVALTRAKTSLVVVGSPSVLKTDKNWRYFLRFCQKNNACYGDAFVMKDEIYYSMQGLSIGSKIKKSADLFDKTFTILKIDDGRTMNTNNDNNRRKNKKSLQEISSKVFADISNTSNTIDWGTTRNRIEPIGYNNFRMSSNDYRPSSNYYNYSSCISKPSKFITHEKKNSVCNIL